MAKKQGSYLDTLSPGYESDTVKEYDPSVEEGQIGKEHQEEVAPENNWESDQRDVIGRAASKRRKLAMKLRRIARELEAMKIDAGADIMDQDYKEDIDDIAEQVQDETTGKSPAELQAEEIPDAVDVASRRRNFINVEATHPIEHDPNLDDPNAFMSSQTGDEQWISIGDRATGAWGSDKRDPIGRAARRR